MKIAFTRFCKSLIVVLGAGCASDDLVSPSSGPLSLAADFVAVPGGTVTLPIPNQNTPEVTVSLPAFSRRTLLRVTVGGTVTTSPTPHNPSGSGTQPGAPRTMGPAGYYFGPPVYGPTIQGCGAQVFVGYPNEAGFRIPCVPDGTSDTINSAQAFIYSAAGYAGTANRTTAAPGLWNCWTQQAGYGPCFYYSTAGQTVTIERVTADFDVTATPTTVSYLDTVTVTASVSPAQVGGFNVPWTVDSVKWAPDAGTQASPCTVSAFVPWTDSPTRTCRRPFSRSGTLTVFAAVNGDLKQKSVRIDVTPPKLTLTATPQAVRPGEAVTFTATVTGAGGAWVGNPAWTWQPDSGQVGDGISSPCYSQNPCTRALTKSGTMTVKVAVSPPNSYTSDTLSASAHVSVVSCLTGDPLLDDSRIRKALKDAYAQSVATNQEQVLAVFHDPSSGLFSLPVPTSYASQCKAVWTPPHPSSFPGTDLVAIVHTHPYKPGTSQWCPEFGNYTGLPGGSPADWKGFNTLQQNADYQAGGWHDLEYWVMNGDFVHVMEPGKSQGSELQPGSTRFSWNSSSCKW